MSEDDRENQNFELDALESVLREGKLTKLSDWTNTDVLIEGSLEIDFYTISTKNVAVYGKTSNGKEFSNNLEMLPPIHLFFKLPNDYPSNSSPIFELKSYWMSEEQRIDCEGCISKCCEENASMTVIYFCYDSIIEKIGTMGIKSINLNDAYLLKNDKTETIDSLKKKVLNESEKAIEENFTNTLFECNVCFDSFMGNECIKFVPCGHVFCKTCTFEYYQSLAQGVVSKALQCLGDKCESEAHPNVIKEALNDELFAKYEKSMLEKAIHDMDDVVQCPRENCLKVAYLTDVNRNLATCSYCDFSFCNLCKQTFHGVSECKFNREEKEKIVNLWNASDDEQKAELYREYGGEKNLKLLIERFLNEIWLESNSKPCPKCSVSIEKNHGCHKMHCTKCDQFFCWLCNSKLSKDDPYLHFRDDGECAGRLFEGIDPMDINGLPDDEDEFFADGNAFFREFGDIDSEDDDDSDFDIEDLYEMDRAFDHGSDDEISEEGEEEVPNDLENDKNEVRGEKMNWSDPDTDEDEEVKAERRAYLEKFQQIDVKHGEGTSGQTEQVVTEEEEA